MNTLHTPWKIDVENAGGGYNIVDARGMRVAHTSRVVSGGVEYVSEPQAKANAIAIVEAVNNASKESA